MPADVSLSDFRPEPTGSATGQGAGKSPGIRRAAFLAFAAFIILGPAPGQLFGLHSPLLREWVMFSGVGTGIPKGYFIVRDGEREVSRHTPLDAAGLGAYPAIKHYEFELRVHTVADLGRFAEALCDTLPHGQQMDFEGYIGTRNGWFAFPNADICAAVDAP